MRGQCHSNVWISGLELLTQQEKSDLRLQNCLEVATIAATCPLAVFTRLKELMRGRVVRLSAT